MKALTLSLFLGVSIASSVYGAYGQTGTASGGYGTNPTGTYADTNSGTYSNSGTYGTSNTQNTTPGYQGSSYSNTSTYVTPSQTNTPGYQQSGGYTPQGSRTGTYNSQGTYQSAPTSQPSYMPPQAANDSRYQEHKQNYINDPSYSTSTNYDSGAAKAKTNSDIKYATEKKYPKDQFKTESDRAVNNRIRNQISGWFSDNFSEIVLRTSEGVVVIDGFVFTPEDQKKLIDELEQVNGVKHVVNNTKIKAK